MAYPEKACRQLADDLAKSVTAIPGPYKTEIEWFREGELGLKGNQCRISAAAAVAAKRAEAKPEIDEIADSVRGVLKRHGFKGEKLLERYMRKGKAYRAFALRKDRATCWANLESSKQLVLEGAPGGRPTQRDPQLVPMWRLTVDCFVG